jgi:hypothetical protein
MLDMQKNRQAMKELENDTAAELDRLERERQRLAQEEAHRQTKIKYAVGAAITLVGLGLLIYAIKK